MITVYDLFVSSSVSLQLQDEGLTRETLASYRRFHNGEVALIAPGFDTLGLYAAYNELHLGTGYAQAYQEHSAYSLQEVAHAIPGFTLSHNGVVWTACGDYQFRIPCASDVRMADAAGKCLLLALRSRVLLPGVVNNMLVTNTSRTKKNGL